MKNQYFLKDKKALIYNVVGRVKKNFSDLLYIAPTTKTPVWCYTRQTSQRLDYNDYNVNPDESRLFVFNYRDDITPFSYIKYKDQWYQVTRTDTADDYNTEVFVYVSDIGKGRKPGATILEYGESVPTGE